MSKEILYIEATSGCSGDMLLGALIDSGVPVEVIARAWDGLGIENYEVEVFVTEKSGMRALQCRVKTEEKKGPRVWKEYRLLIEKANLPDRIKTASLALIERVFQTEAEIHGLTLSKLHLHEMGGTDLLLDVIGALTAVDYLGPADVRCSAINTGRGFVKFSHGRYPIPAPATTRLLKGLPIFQNEVEGELTTPTGALLLSHIVSSFGEMPRMKLNHCGVGAGEREIPGHPNVLRIFRGTKDSDEEEIYLVESNIDDSSPQVLAYFMERALQQGALDAFFTPVFMKKNRPAVRLTLLVTKSSLDSIIHLLFAETTAIGLRYWNVDRKKLDRQWKTIHLEKMEIRIKESFLNGTLYNYQPEFEDCKKAAEKLKRPLKKVITQALHEYLKL